MTDFQPIAVFVKQSEMNTQLSQIDERKEYLQVIVDMYNQADISEPLQENDLFDLVNTPKDFLIKKITKDIEFNLGGLKLDAEKVFALLEKPKGTIELLEYIETSKSANDRTKFLYRHASQFVLIDGTVELSPTALESIEQSFTVYVKDQKEKDFFDLLTSICKSINDLKNIKRIYNIDEALFRDLIALDRHTETVSVNLNSLNFYRR